MCIYGQPLIEMYAEGGVAHFQSGPNHYTVFTDGSGSNTASVICSSRTLVPELLLMKDNIIIRNGQNVRGIQMNFIVDELFPGKYSCVVKSTTQTVKGAFISFTTSTDIIITVANWNNPSCGTAFGSSLIDGELVDFYCYGGYVTWQGRHGVNVQTVRVEPSDVPEYTCEGIHFFTNESVNCEVLVDIDAGPIVINISPTQFFSDDNDLEFTCRTSPHRLVYWGIYEMKGNLLDWDNFEFSFSVSTNLTIRQTETESVLQISKTAIRGNGIRKVLCYTYNTMKERAFSTYSDDSTIDGVSSLSTDSVSPLPEVFTIRGAAAVASVALITLFVIITFVMTVCLISWSRTRTTDESNPDANYYSEPSNNYETHSHLQTRTSNPRSDVYITTVAMSADIPVERVRSTYNEHSERLPRDHTYINTH